MKAPLYKKASLGFIVPKKTGMNMLEKAMMTKKKTPLKKIMKDYPTRNNKSVFKNK